MQALPAPDQRTGVRRRGDVPCRLLRPDGRAGLRRCRRYRARTRRCDTGPLDIWPKTARSLTCAACSGRYGCPGLRSAEQIRAAADALVEADWLRPPTPGNEFGQRGRVTAYSRQSPAVGGSAVSRWSKERSLPFPVVLTLWTQWEHSGDQHPHSVAECRQCHGDPSAICDPDGRCPRSGGPGRV